MADDARISTALPRHPKTVKLQRRLGAQGCWSLVCLFLWVAENRSDGDLAGLTPEDIEIAAGWSGDSGEFVRALAEVRFLDGEEGSFLVHDWAEHNPWAANRGRRIEAAKQAANMRWERRSDAVRMPVASAAHESAMPTTQPNPTPPNPTQPKKRSGADAPSPPDWLPIEAWTGFLEMRKKKGASPTNRAISLLLKKLEQFRAAGDDPAAVLDQSTRSNWTDVYPLKGAINGKRDPGDVARNIYERELSLASKRPH
jgi:hypothetical protein